MARVGLPFDVATADADETPLTGEAPTALARRLASAKAVAVAMRRRDAIVVAADTVVARRQRIYGKPGGSAEAIAMLGDLVGRWHRVITAVTVVAPAGARSGNRTSRVLMRAWSSSEIARYVATGDPLDKAGGYGIQNQQFRPVAQLRGCHCNVVGFPLGVVAALLIDLGCAPPVGAAMACPYGRYAARRCL
jgi:MAF protein